MEYPFEAILSSENETEAIAKSFASGLAGGEVIVLLGELGAGKTFFVRKALMNFGITWVNSPSFAIVNEYKDSFRFCHIDFYRLKSVKELFDIGFDDYLNDKDSIIFIEWGNLFPEVLPAKRIEIKLSIKSDTSREILIKMPDKLPILSIETSQNCCGACVYFDENKFFEMNINLKNSHAEKIFEIIDSVIKTSGVRLNDLGVVAVLAGPGSFTGVRIGMSAAKGIALGASLPIVPVPTFEALAFQLSNHLHDGTEFIIANKVNLEEIYFAKFKVRTNNYIFTQDLQIVKVSDEIHIEKDCVVYGNASFNFKPITQFRTVNSPKPEYIAKWAEHFGNNSYKNDFDFLEPNYLKNFIVKDKKL